MRARPMALLVGMLLVTITAGPALTQQSETAPTTVPTPAQIETARRVQQLMADGSDHITAGAQLLTKAAAEGDAGAASQAEGLARYEAGVKSYAAMLPLLDEIQDAFRPSPLETFRQLAHYNTACARALQGRKQESVDAFGKALEAGFDDFARLEREQSLDSIRAHPRFAQLLERPLAELADERAKSEALRAETEAQRAAAEQESLSGGALFPFDLSLTTLNGAKLELADLRGKVVIVDYWGTWCAACRVEIPHFVQLKQELGDAIEIVGLTWERGKTDAVAAAKVLAFARDLDVTYPLAFASPQELRLVPGGISVFPTTLFLDKAGRVRVREGGYRDLKTLRSLVEALVAEPDEPLEEPEQDTPAEPF